MNIATLCVNCKQNNSCTMCWKTSNKKCPHFIQITNADRIRAMNDEELAKFLDFCESMGYKDSSIATDSDGHCVDMLAWLQQPFDGE